MRAILLSKQVPELLLDTGTVRFRPPYPWLLQTGKHDYIVAKPRTEPVKTPQQATPQEREVFEKFTGHPYRKVSALQICAPKNLVYKGTLKGVEYVSPKEFYRANASNPRQLYIHTTENPHPQVYSTADGKTWVIRGGKMRTSTKGKIAWLED